MICDALEDKDVVGCIKLIESKRKIAIEATIALLQSDNVDVDNAIYDLNIKGLEVFKGKKLIDAKKNWNFSDNQCKKFFL